MKKNIIFLSIILTSIIINSCCECLEEGEETKPFCSPREATVTKFDPTLIQTVLQDENGNDSIVYYPTDAYNIHAFEFPISKSSSGSLPIDNQRYSSEAGRDRVAIAQSALPTNIFNTYPVYLAVLNDLPANSDIIGDFIISDVDLTDPNNPSAYIRFKGWLEFVQDNELSESSQDFCDFYETNFEKDNYDDDLKQYGEGVVDNSGTSRSVISNNSNIVSLIDGRGNILIEDINNPQTRLTGGNYNMNEIQLWNAIQQLLTNNGINDITTTEDYNSMLDRADEKRIIDVEVRIGDYFYYQSIKGKKYLIQIQNISERINNGIKHRVSFMFTDTN